VRTARSPPRPCGCTSGPAIVLNRCPEAERLWAAFRELGDAANSTTPEWAAYRGHFKKRGKR
jgi:hypothetical protein